MTETRIDLHGLTLILLDYRTLSTFHCFISYDIDFSSIMVFFSPTLIFSHYDDKFHMHSPVVLPRFIEANKQTDFYHYRLMKVKTQKFLLSLLEVRPIILDSFEGVT